MDGGSAAGQFSVWSQVFGAFVASGLGLGAAALWRWRDRVGNQRRVAKAVLAEMVQTINHLVAYLPELRRCAKEVKNGHADLSRGQVDYLKPFDRHVITTLGDKIGSLSALASQHAVAFDGTFQAMERRLRGHWYSEGTGKIMADGAQDVLATVEDALKLGTQNARVIAQEAFIDKDKIPNSIGNVLARADALIGTEGAVADDPQYEHKMRVWEIEKATATQIFSAHTAAIIGFASLAINSLILANSAAAGAVLALLATMWGKKEMAAVGGPAILSVTIFAAGVFAGIVSAMSSYFTQYLYAWAERLAMAGKSEKLAMWTAYVFHIFAILAAILALSSFAWGCWEGIDALRASNLGVEQQPAN